jgi:dipeptidyl aminopeptidase/acylaminoacyl peptidase
LQRMQTFSMGSRIIKKNTKELERVGISGQGLRAAAVWMSMCAASVAKVDGSQTPPVEAFASAPAVSDVAMSPDGSRLAWLDGTSSPPRVVVFDLQQRKYRRFVNLAAESKLDNIRWTDNETVLVTVSVTHDRGRYGANWVGGDFRHFEIHRTIAVDIAGTDDRILLMTDREKRQISGAAVVSLQGPRPKTLFMATLESMPGAVDQDWKYSLFEVDTRTGRGKVFLPGTQFTQGWIVGSGGAQVAREEYDKARKLFVIQLRSGDSWRDIYRTEDDRQLRLEAFSADGASIIAVGHIGEGQAKMWSMPVDGSAPRALVEDADEEIISADIDRTTGAVLGAWLGGANPNPVWIDPETQRRQEMLKHSFPEQQIDLVAYSEAAKRTLVRVSSASKPPVYYVVDFKTHNAEMVGEELPGLAGAALGKLQEITYAARDGQSITAYLTLPPGTEGRNLPLIVLPHGGLGSRDYPFSFDWLAQFLASRGYAVLKPQFRGSMGFGEAFYKAGHRQWGGLIQDDVSDAVAAMVERGVADPKRVCIVGFNYAGYTALAGAAFTPQLYRCAVSINGISNLPEMSLFVREHYSVSWAKTWQERVGEWSDRELIEKSPGHAASKIVAPVLLLHASNNSVVPPRQSEGMANALRAAGKPVVFVTLPGNDHWLEMPESRLRVLQEIEKFLAANL